MGNVLSVIIPDASDATQPAIERLTDYYPFGMEEPGRSYNSNTSRFGYTGHEKESDVAEGVYTTQYRLLDTRLGRWMSVDPLFAKYPELSSYAYCMGTPTVLIDPDGRGFNGGFPIENNTNQKIVLGGCTAKYMKLTEVEHLWGLVKRMEIDLKNTYETENITITLEPEEKLVPRVEKVDDKTYNYIADIYDKNGNLKSTVDAFDVDYIKLSKGQTFVFDGKRYNTDNSDVNAVTPTGPFKDGTLKISSSIGRAIAGKTEELPGTTRLLRTEYSTGKVVLNEHQNGDIEIDEKSLEGVSIKIEEKEHDGSK